MFTCYLFYTFIYTFACSIFTFLLYLYTYIYIYIYIYVFIYLFCFTQLHKCHFIARGFYSCCLVTDAGLLNVAFMRPPANVREARVQQARRPLSASASASVKNDDMKQLA